MAAPTCYLLSLPPELRMTIYQLVVVYHGYEIDVLSLPPPRTCIEDCRVCLYPALTRVGGTIGAEALSTFFSENVFRAHLLWQPHVLPPPSSSDVIVVPPPPRFEAGILGLTRALARLGPTHCRELVKLRITWGHNYGYEASLPTLLAWTALWADGPGRHCRLALRQAIQHDYCIDEFVAIPPAYSSELKQAGIRTRLRRALQKLGRGFASKKLDLATGLKSAIVSWVMTIDGTHNEDLKSLIRKEWRSMAPSATDTRRITHWSSPTPRRNSKPSFADLPVAIRQRIYKLALNVVGTVPLAEVTGDIDFSTIPEWENTSPFADPLAGLFPRITSRGSLADFLADLPPLTRMRNVFGREALAIYFSTVTFELELDFTSSAMTSLKTFYGRLEMLHCADEQSDHTKTIPLTLLLAWRWTSSARNLDTLVEYANMFAPGGSGMPGRFLRIIDASAITPLTQTLTMIREALERASRNYTRRPTDYSSSRMLIPKSKASRHRRSGNNKHSWNPSSMIAWMYDDHERDSMAARAACRELCHNETYLYSIEPAYFADGKATSSMNPAKCLSPVPPPPEFPPGVFALPPDPLHTADNSLWPAPQSHTDAFWRPDDHIPIDLLMPSPPLHPPQQQHSAVLGDLTPWQGLAASTDQPYDPPLSPGLAADNTSTDQQKNLQMSDCEAEVTTPPPFSFPPELAPFLPPTMLSQTDSVADLSTWKPIPFPPNLRHPRWTYKGSEYPFEEGKAPADDLF